MRISDWSSDVCSSDLVDILPGQRRHLQLDALLAAMTDPVLALDSAGNVLLANPALIALYGREPAGESVAELFGDKALLGSLLEHGFRLPLREIGRASCRDRVCQYV